MSAWGGGVHRSTPRRLGTVSARSRSIRAPRIRASRFPNSVSPAPTLVSRARKVGVSRSELRGWIPMHGNSCSGIPARVLLLRKLFSENQNHRMNQNHRVNQNHRRNQNHRIVPWKSRVISRYLLRFRNLEYKCGVWQLPTAPESALVRIGRPGSSRHGSGRLHGQRRESAQAGGRAHQRPPSSTKRVGPGSARLGVACAGSPGSTSMISSPFCRKSGST